MIKAMEIAQRGGKSPTPSQDAKDKELEEAAAALAQEQADLVEKFDAAPGFNFTGTKSVSSGELDLEREFSPVLVEGQWDTASGLRILVADGVCTWLNLMMGGWR